MTLSCASSTNQQAHVDWSRIERGVPITNDCFFVRIDAETGLVYDDLGGYMHQHFCNVDTRREITWIEHDQSSECPTGHHDVVLTESKDGQLQLTSAHLVVWKKTNQFRVVRQQETVTEQKTYSSNKSRTFNQTLRKYRGSITVFIALICIFLV